MYAIKAIAAVFLAAWYALPLGFGVARPRRRWAKVAAVLWRPLITTHPPRPISRRETALRRFGNAPSELPTY